MNVLAFACVVGFLLSIPVGPVSSLVIRQAVARGFGAGLAAGAGVALADAIYGALGIVGATLPFAVALASGPARIAAGALLVALGIALLRARVRLEPDAAGANFGRTAAGFAGTFGVAIVNPGATPIVAAAFAAARVPAMAPTQYPLALVALFAGALAWWAVLAGVLVRVRERLGEAGLRVLNGATGGIAVVAGLVTIASAVRALPALRL